MRLTYLAYSFSLTIIYFSVILLLPIIVALVYHETNAIFPFLITGTSALMIAATIRKVIGGISEVKSINDIKKSEGLCIVTFSWIFGVILASVPFLFFGISPIDAIFEATSGITATGAIIFLACFHAVAWRYGNYRLSYRNSSPVCDCRSSNVLRRSTRAYRG